MRRGTRYSHSVGWDSVDIRGKPTIYSDCSRRDSSPYYLIRTLTTLQGEWDSSAYCPIKRRLVSLHDGFQVSNVVQIKHIHTDTEAYLHVFITV